MQIQVTDIPKQGLDVAYEARPGDLGIDSDDCQLESGVAVRLHLERSDGSIFVTGSATAQLALQCSRCLDWFSFPLDLDLYAGFEPVQPEGRGPRVDTDRPGLPGAARPEPADYEYSGDSIAVTEFIREQLILAIPMVPICRGDCLGLCSRCGENLNRGDCSCGPVPPDLTAFEAAFQKRRKPNKGKNGPPKT